MMAGFPSFQAILDAVDHGVVVYDPSTGEVVEVNERMCAMHGYTREECLAFEVGDFSADEPPHERENARQLMRKAVTEGPQRYRWVNRRREGDLFRVDVTLHCTEVEGEERVVATVRDLRRHGHDEEMQHESEQKFRALAEEALVGISLIQDGRFQYVNETYAEIFGYDRAEMIDTFPVETVIYPADRPKVRENLRKRLDGEVDAVQYQVRGYTKEGETIYVKIYGRRFTYRGKPAIIGCVLDVTRERRLEEELLQIQERERRRMGRELHDGIASDLTGIALIVSSLVRRAKKGKQIAPEELSEVTTFLNETIRETQSLSRGLSPIGLEQGLESALEDLAERTQRHDDLDCSFEATDALPDLSAKTATHLYRIAQEAVGNAIKHAEADRIWIRLATEGESLVLEVQDDGKGWSEPSAGDGLGMRTMHYRANLTGSTLAIEEAPEGGTLVRCRVPASRYQSTVRGEQSVHQR